MSNLNVPSRNSEGAAPSEHPSKFRISFKGDTGEWEIYNKATKEKSRVPSEKFVFMPLIRTSGASGYYQPAQMGYWSNEIQDSRSEVLEVMGNDKSVFVKGLWKQIKEKCNERNISFIANLYVAIKVDGAYAIAVIELKTTALVAFGDFSKSLITLTGKSNAVYNTAVKVGKLTPKKNGSVNYVVPTFVAVPVSEGGMIESGKLADTCISFLEAYFEGSPEAEQQAQAPVQQQQPQAQQQVPTQQQPQQQPAQTPAQASSQVANQNFAQTAAQQVPTKEDMAMMYGEGGVDLGSDDDLPF